MGGWLLINGAVIELEAPVLDLLSYYDIGSSDTDNLTGNTSLRFLFDGPEMRLGDAFYLYDNDAQVATGTTTDFVEVISGLSWAAGTHSITAKYGRSGALSAASDPLVVTVRTTAPSLTSATGTATGPTTADISVTTDVADGTWYYVVDENLTTPTATQVMAGTNAAGEIAARYGNNTVASTGVKTAGLEQLWYDTTFKVYFVHKDAAGLVSSVAASSSFTTDSLTTPLVWESGSQPFNYASSASHTISTTVPGPHTVIVFVNQLTGGVDGVTFNGVAGDDAYLGAASPHFQYKEFTEPTDVVVDVDYTAPGAAVMNWVVLIGTSGPSDGDGAYSGSSGTQAFPDSTIPTGGIGLAYCAGYNAATLPSSWTNATALAAAAVGTSNVSIAAALVAAPWSSVSCSTTNGQQSLFSTTWALTP